MTAQLVLRDLAPLIASTGWSGLAFEPFKEGVQIYWIRQESPQVALLKYEAGAAVGRHRHIGLETILVLEGDQQDENGEITVGDFVVNQPGSEHSVRSKSGCVVLIQWEKPVAFV